MTENFSKFGWTVPLKHKIAQTIKDSFENILLCSERKSELIETDRGEQFYNKIFQSFSNNNSTRHYSRNTSPGAVFAERLNRSLRDLLKGPIVKRVMVIGLMYYPQKRNNIITEYILPLN